MDMATFLGIEDLGDGRHYRVEVGNQLITPGEFLYGGSGLALCVETLEMAAGRPLVWASAQFVSYAAPGDVLDLEVEIPAHGKNVTQARVTARHGAREVVSAMASLGTGSHSEGVFVTPVEVPGPEECPRREPPWSAKDTLFEILELRLALGRNFKEMDGTPGEPRYAVWARLPGIERPTASTLSIFGDTVANAVTQLTGVRMIGRSLDNTIRVSSLEATEWVLVDVRMDAYVNGFSQGSAYLWSEAGTLLATASQTQVVKPLPPGSEHPGWGGKRASKVV